MDSYIKDISNKFGQSSAKEMIYRADMENLLKDIFQLDGKVMQINHDSTNDKGNKPDFIILKNTVPILYIEAKDIGVNLDKVEKGEQMARYFGYSNLILTDYLEFRFYRNGIKYGEPIRIGKQNKDKKIIEADSEKFGLLKRTLVDFASSHKEPIRKGKHLSQIMGGRAARIRDNVKEMLQSNNPDANLEKIFSVVKENLLASMDLEMFADMYAQTLVYGLFVARYSDKSPDNFSRQEARDLQQKTNPFLKEFFDHIAGASFPDRLSFIVDELCEIFSHSNIKDLLHDTYGYEKDNKDPIIHFYEDFLKEYDSQKKMEMGVFYTPKEVVQFIVRSVDEILKTEFNLPNGLADNSKITKKVNAYDHKGKLVQVDKEYHRVQILDIATGTGAFLNETILQIYKKFENNKGSWEVYVKEHLIPRLHGFELMMASYTIAHLKLGITLEEIGVKNLDKRLGVYLTNTLEEGVDNKLQGTLFGVMESIAEEAREASKIKNELPVMVIMGNPPYNVASTNKGEFILNLLKDYKKNLNERKINLDDDYIKFIRFSENLIEKNGSGVMAMITNNSFIDGITHRQMRKHLLETFDKIYIVDLHGNLNKAEITPEGGKDQNIFEIKQGVCITFMIKSLDKLNKTSIYHTDIFGKQNEKLNTLSKLNLKEIKWTEVLNESNEDQNYFFVPKDQTNIAEYSNGIKVNEIFNEGGSGIKTERDSVTIHFTKNELEILLRNFKNLDLDQIKSLYKIGKDSRDWSVKRAKEEIISLDDNIYNFIKTINYRPFDERVTLYTGKSKHFIGTPGYKIAKNFINNKNLGLLLKRQSPRDFSYIFMVNNIAESCMFESAYANNNVYPLFLYNGTEKINNIKTEVLKKFKAILEQISPEDVLDYIYSILYIPKYRNKYREFLKIDFPRIPYPTDKESFLKFAEKGKRLRELHLMEASDLESLEKTTFNISGSNIVDKVSFENNRVYINAEQYFENVSDIAWNFYIGGYQPAQKWLKDRKGRELNFEDIEHYRKIIAVLEETDKVMKELDFLYE